KPSSAQTRADGTPSPPLSSAEKAGTPDSAVADRRIENAHADFTGTERWLIIATGLRQRPPPAMNLPLHFAGFWAGWRRNRGRALIIAPASRRGSHGAASGVKARS